MTLNNQQQSQTGWIDGVRDLLYAYGAMRIADMYPEQFAGPPAAQVRDPGVDAAMTQAESEKQWMYGMIVAGLVIAAVMIAQD